ncbi:cytochrome c [Dyella sp.]|jgi:mono/diheme cytochrome c family protein|uniref:c-type cytochrome n=1 Tax=Dyella sp. TaxID=1869338 RepID=UPI002D7675DD|nr:cytochrome c [Dyella sp.]HET6432790.1 cytochrome c [Dyella sp.]
MTRRIATVLACLSLLWLGGCERAMHDMYQQPKDEPGEPSPLFANGSSQRPPPPGAVVYSASEAADTSSGRRGLVTPPAYRSVAAVPLDQQGRSRVQGEPRTVPRDNPRAVTMALLERGQERYGIYCAACHGLDGRGDGMVPRRGYPSPPSYHSERLRQAPDSHFYNVITHGYGVMYPYADRVAPDDRWAIVAYVRALQLSQHLPAAQLSAADRDVLAAGTAARRGARQ